MGPNVYTKYDEDLCCPVCKHPLSNPGSPPKPKHHRSGARGKGRPPHVQHNQRSRKETQEAISKSSSKDNDDVVVAQCGHLFHKFCLRHYCYLYREGRLNDMTRVTCPICHRSISMSSAQAIFYREHQDVLTNSEKEGIKITLMNNELVDQVKSAKSKFKKLNESCGDAGRNLDIYSSHLKKLKKDLKGVKRKKSDIEALYREIQKTDKMLAFMQTQHLKIVRKFITKVKEKDPKDYVHFPTRLAPYLDVIEKDDRLVRDLGEVVMPIHLNHLKSDRLSLLKGIIECAAEKLNEEHQNRIENEEVMRSEKDAKRKAFQYSKQEKKPLSLHPFKNPKRPPIFVKVRKSSVSILSSTTLTKASIQKIIETVRAPIQAMKTNKALKKATFSKEKVNKVSASDIKIIYMPKRKMMEPVSEPCRAIEPSDSFFINVPPRRCRSTDAILIKQRKRKKRGPFAGNADGRASHREANNVLTKRSRSVEVITSNTHSTTANLKNDAIIQVSLQSSCCSKKPSALIAIVSLPDVQSDKDKLQELQADLNSDRREEIPPIPEIESEKYEDENNNIKPTDKEDEAVYKPVQARVSVLQIIYDDLENERKSNHYLDSINNKSWKTMDENQNPVKESTPRKKIDFDIGKPPSEEIVSQPPPQFYRVDGKGNVRPESPYRMCFRQPTFLSSFTDIINERTSFMVGCTEPDEENQLEALSSEDRYLLAMEQEAILAGKGSKRQMLLGFPACLGVPPSEQSQTNETLEAQSIPVYLRRWQRQLPSQKIFNPDSKQEILHTHVAECRSARIPLKRSSISQYRQRPRMGLQQRIFPTEFKKPSENLRLPPLYMFPAKRPSTADCVRIKESQQLEASGELDDSLPSIYDYANTNPVLRS